MQELVKDKLYSFDEKVRVEIGPQIVEMDCTNDNLDNSITHANYRIGKIDAFGQLITAEKVATADTKMNCVDWRAKHAPHMWKVYQMQKMSSEEKLEIIKAAIKANIKPNPMVERFIKVNEFKNKKEALTFAEELFNKMGA